ncbi:MAG: type 1 glutamine amidotransferase domain-containing protein [Sandaracinaceae bacterium]
MARVLMPLPSTDFDPSESAVPFTVLTEAGHEVVIATPDGRPAQADPIVLRGPLGALSGSMKASPEVARLYEAMREHDAYAHPLAWANLRDADVDGLFLVGGHAPGMKPYLESEDVRQAVLRIFGRHPVAAICHGVLVLARTIDPSTSRSVLAGGTSTCLPSYMERLAWHTTRWRLGDYYKTYPADVEEEVTQALGPDGEFVRGPTHLFAKGTRADDRNAFVVDDGDYLSARWPGDAWLIARRFAERLPDIVAASPAA